MKKSILISVVALLGCGYSFGQCASNLTITGPYSTPLTQSSDWIVTSGTSTIPTGSNVTLEANNYIQLNPVFTADATAVFLAHIVPCTLGLSQYDLSEFKVYPNPTSGKINIQSSDQINTVTIYDNNGRMLQVNNSIQSTFFETNLESFSTGIYYIEISTDKGQTRRKISKN